MRAIKVPDTVRVVSTTPDDPGVDFSFRQWVGVVLDKCELFGRGTNGAKAARIWGVISAAEAKTEVLLESEDWQVLAEAVKTTTIHPTYNRHAGPFRDAVEKAEEKGTNRP